MNRKQRREKQKAARAQQKLVYRGAAPDSRVWAYTATCSMRHTELFTFADICGEVERTASSEERISFAVSHAKRYQGVWDTGAAFTTVSERVAKDFQLPHLEFKLINTAAGPAACSVHLVTVILPSGLILPNIKVAAMPLPDDDFLIGMDIIGKGDFAVTHSRGVTQYSFQMPSTHSIDFVREQGLGVKSLGVLPIKLPYEL